jgi:Ca2+-transporting ATPase
MTARPWHTIDANDASNELRANLSTGLTEREAAHRAIQYGPNEITRESGPGVLKILVRQLTDFMIVVLLIAAVVSGVLGERYDAIAIVVIVVLNAAFGAIQEYRAQRAVEALRRMSAPEARVLRDSKAQSIAAKDLVPGDILLLQAGDVVGADARLLETQSLRTDESALTGESLPVEKSPRTLEHADMTVGDRINMVFKSTSVTRGDAKALIVATGETTEIGRIAALLREESGGKTPLQQRLSVFGRRLAYAILFICTVIFFVGLLQGHAPMLMFLTVVSLAVAAVPEALPAVATVALALGARKLAARKTLVRRLPAVESLGSVTFICADKTGTLTENRMTVGVVATIDERETELPNQASGRAWDLLTQGMVLNNDVEEGTHGLRGDPTEAALFVAAKQAGLDIDKLRTQLPRIKTLAFDADRRIMTTVHQSGAGWIAFSKGAPEAVLAICDSMLTRTGPEAVNGPRIRELTETLAGDGYRVLAFAFREVDRFDGESADQELESRLCFIGLAGLIDPLRPEAVGAVAQCRGAGIVPVMITGDHPETALAIARQAGIADISSPVLTGRELATLSDEELAQRLRDVRVCARVDPEQKIKIVGALQEGGEFTDVAREAADMVLLDDNFATIVAAVEEGRRIYDDIRKFIRYTMTSNSGEIWTLLLAPLLGLPIPLVPIQILWINLVTDGLPGLALTAEPAERDIMRRPPRPSKESLFAHGMWQHMLWVGLLIGGLSITAQALGYMQGYEYWQTMVFTTLVIAQLFHALAIRSERDALWTIGLTSNPPLLGAIGLTVAAQLAIIYLPPFNPIFKTTPLPLADLAVCFALGSIVLVAVEIDKWRRRVTSEANTDRSRPGT